MNSLFNIESDENDIADSRQKVSFVGGVESDLHKEVEESLDEVDEKKSVVNVVPYEPISEGEAIKQQGIAWTMGLVFFGSVVFMLLLGWFADLLFGSSPWGIVVGIVLGSLMGFVQFFRLSSEMYKK